MRRGVSFPGQVLLALFSAGCLGLYPLLKFSTREIISAVVAGALLTTVNVLLGYAAIEYSAGKSTATFFKVVLGGMGIRLFLIAGLLVLLLRVFHFHALALISSMGIFYIVYLTMEIIYIQKKVSTKHQGS